MTKEYEFDSLDQYANKIMSEVTEKDLLERRKLFASIFNLINYLQSNDDIVLTKRNKKKLDNIMIGDWIERLSA